MNDITNYYVPALRDLEMVMYYAIDGEGNLTPDRLKKYAEAIGPQGMMQASEMITNLVGGIDDGVVQIVEVD